MNHFLNKYPNEWLIIFDCLTKSFFFSFDVIVKNEKLTKHCEHATRNVQNDFLREKKNENAHAFEECLNTPHTRWIESKTKAWKTP